MTDPYAVVSEVAALTRGRVDATGFVFAPEIVSTETVASRIRSLWTEGARLLQYGSGLLLLLPRPISIRAEHAPGQPVIRRDGAVLLPRGGEIIEVEIADLQPADLRMLVDIAHLQLERSEPADSEVAAIAAPDPMAPADQPDLRRSAGIGAPDGGLAAGLSRMQQQTDRMNPARAGRGRPGAGSAAPRSGSGWLVQWALRTPAQGILGRRHARYVRELTERFQRRDWDTALRSAIGVGGSGGVLSLRLPRMRDAVRGPGVARAAGGSIPYGETVQAHLRSLYREAAKDLEAEGKVALAAFVLADLLHDASAAAELLERHGFYDQAAQVAEGWKLDPSLVVRLWWRADDRLRAVRIARARGAFAVAIEMLGRVAPADAVELRREWMLERRAAGDHLGAVEAAWPDESLRAESLPDLAAGIAGGGAASGILLGYALALETFGQFDAAARVLLTTPGPEALEERRGLMERLAVQPAKDKALDSELTTTALLALTEPGLAVSARWSRDLVAKLRPRADQLVVADLPRDLPGPVPPQTNSPLELDLTASGLLALHDAVALGPDLLVLALGDLGTRVVDRHGRVRGRWDVPADRIIVADHGKRVLLVAQRGMTSTLHSLDLPLSRPVALPPLQARRLVDTYDGARLIANTDDGLQWLEVENGRWRVAWQELNEPGILINEVARSADSMAASFQRTESGQRERWRWDLPRVTLRERKQITAHYPAFLLASGALAAVTLVDEDVVELMWDGAARTGSSTAGRFSVDAAFVGLGDGYATIEEADGVIDVYGDSLGSHIARLRTSPETTPIVRRHGDLICVGHSGGRAAVFDVLSGLVADIRLSG